MKIKVTEKSYEEVLALPRPEHKKPKKQSAAMRLLLQFLSGSELRATEFSWEVRGRALPEGPCMILMNHSSFTDLQIVAKLFAKRPYHIVCTNDGFIGKEGLMRAIGCIPTRKFISDTMLIRDMKYVLEELGESVIMYPEASYSFDGSETPLPDSLGKCLKLLKAPVLMVKTDGAFLRDPLYNNLQKRAAKITAEVSCLFTAEELKELSAEAVNAALREEFRYDHFRSQKEKGILVKEPFRADHLHRVLYKCPACMSEGKTKGEGTAISCESCGKKWELSEDGTLRAHSGATEFDFVTDWYAWERDCVRREAEQGDYEMNLEVDILMLADLNSMYRVGSGTLSHNCSGFTLSGCDGALSYTQTNKASYGLYADYYWYELGDMVSIGDHHYQYYCFPKDQKGAIVAKARLAAEELWKLAMVKHV